MTSGAAPAGATLPSRKELLVDVQKFVVSDEVKRVMAFATLHLKDAFVEMGFNLDTARAYSPLRLETQVACVWEQGLSDPLIESDTADMLDIRTKLLIAYVDVAPEGGYQMRCVIEFIIPGTFEDGSYPTRTVRDACTTTEFTSVEDVRAQLLQLMHDAVRGDDAARRIKGRAVELSSYIVQALAP